VENSLFAEGGLPIERVINIFQMSKCILLHQVQQQWQPQSWWRRTFLHLGARGFKYNISEEGAMFHPPSFTTRPDVSASGFVEMGLN
jgi:hypothetical protein